MMIDTNMMKAARAILGWTQADLATQAGLSHHTIQLIEQGRRPSQGTVLKIEAAFEKHGVRMTPGGVEWRLKNQ